ncbi:hypothetical protein BC835DRAFT_1422965 [Cytidiella melzeri]|nr:hypothetical protein BC835DRAFT_1422965 [Cytidiella melzeri]
MSGGDIVLISSDQVRFTVHKVILSNASPVFEGMLSLPSTGADPKDTGLPHCPPATRLVHLPSLNGTVSDLDTLRLLFTAADKYEMKGVTSQLAYMLRWQFLETYPYFAYAIACKHGLWDVATLAGKQTLAHPAPGPSLPEYDVLPAAVHHKLVDYRKKCADIIDALLENCRYHVWGQPHDFFWAGYGTSCSEDFQPGAQWFMYHLSRTKAAFMERPRSATVLSDKLMQGIPSYRCPTPQCDCRPARLAVFNERLAEALDRKLAEIPFVLP